MTLKIKHLDKKKGVNNNIAFFVNLQTKIDDFDFLANFVGEFLKGYRTSNDKAITRIPQSKVNVGLQLFLDGEIGSFIQLSLDKVFTHKHLCSCPLLVLTVLTLSIP